MAQSISTLLDLQLTLHLIRMIQLDLRQNYKLTDPLFLLNVLLWLDHDHDHES
jgi:hypothetical protein